MKVAAIQFNHQAGDKAYNLDRIRSLTASAAQQDVQLVVFPEMCITGYWHVRKLSREQIQSLAERIPDGESTQVLLHLARKHQMIVGAGLIEAADDGKLYNSFVVAMPDGQIAVHRKLHCFISQHMSSGDQFTVFDTPQGIKMAVLICYDNNIGENVRACALQGAQVLLAPHQTGGCNSPSPRCMGTIDPQLWQQRHEKPELNRSRVSRTQGQRVVDALVAGTGTRQRFVFDLQ